LFSLEISGFSGFSFRLSAISGKADDAKVETAHRALTPIMAPNLGILSRKRQFGSDIKPKDADTRARHHTRGCSAAEPTLADEKIRTAFKRIIGSPVTTGWQARFERSLRLRAGGRLRSEFAITIRLRAGL
jgi:hypothetical protein